MKRFRVDVNGRAFYSFVRLVAGLLLFVTGWQWTAVAWLCWSAYLAGARD